MTQQENERRAERGRRALDRYSTSVKDMDESLTDLLTDLMHTFDTQAHLADFDAALRMATIHFHAERP